QALQGQTGTRIWVDVEASEVRISGPQEGVEVARDLVQELLSGNTPAALMPQAAMDPTQGPAGMLTEATPRGAPKFQPPAVALRRFRNGPASLPTPVPRATPGVGALGMAPATLAEQEEPAYPADWPGLPGMEDAAADAGAHDAAARMLPPPRKLLPRPTRPQAAPAMPFL
ncbi:unnamed protein product, partial [Prorocentrum cordatum]